MSDALIELAAQQPVSRVLNVIDDLAVMAEFEERLELVVLAVFQHLRESGRKSAGDLSAQVFSLLGVFLGLGNLEDRLQADRPTLKQLLKDLTARITFGGVIGLEKGDDLGGRIGVDAPLELFQDVAARRTTSTSSLLRASSRAVSAADPAAHSFFEAFSRTAKLLLPSC